MPNAAHAFVKNSFGAGIALALSVLVLASGAAQAERQVKDLDDPIMAILQNRITFADSKVGDTFEAKTAEDVRYKDFSLPANTVFSGHVAKMQHSRRLNRPGYTILQVDRATTPDGRVFAFDGGKYDVRSKKLHNLGGRTFPNTFLTQSPYTATSLATSIPLRTATDLNGGIVTAISTGARMFVGGVIGVADASSEHSAPVRFLGGAWQGTGIPRGYNFLFKRDAELALAAGTEIPIYMDKKGLRDLFNNQIVSSK